MHKSLSVIFFGIITLLAQAQQNTKELPYTINGSIKGLTKGTKLFLSHKYDGKTFTDTIISGEGKFSFKGNTPESNMYWLQIENKPKNMVLFFIDKGSVEIVGKVDSLGNSKIKAGSTQNDYDSYNNLIKNTDIKKRKIVDDFNKAQQMNNTKIMEENQKLYDITENDLSNQMKNFIKTHPSSPVSGYIIYAFFSPETTPYQTLDSLYDMLSPEIKNSKYGKVAYEKIAHVKGTSIGFEALTFTQNDVNNKPVSLSDYKGKYVLIDFWASWCGPCRAENPNVVKAYNAFKEKGFDILGVSLDSKKENWLKAIEKDHLTWTQVSDLKGWENEVAMNYGIRSIPANILLDKEGKIIAKNLRGEDLEAKLAELIK